VVDRATNCSGCGIGKGRKTTALSKLKIAVFAPIPSAKVRSAAIVPKGFLRIFGPRLLAGGLPCGPV
jgi:hypothetical protein